MLLCRPHNKRTFAARAKACTSGSPQHAPPQYPPVFVKKKVKLTTDAKLGTYNLDAIVQLLLYLQRKNTYKHKKLMPPKYICTKISLFCVKCNNVIRHVQDTSPATALAAIG